MAQDVASWYRQNVLESYAPTVSLSVVVRHDPYYERVARLFENAAPDLIAMAASNAISSLHLAPNGVVRMACPDHEEGTEPLGFDLFTGEDLSVSLEVIKYGALSLMGPLGSDQGAFVIHAHLPIFIHNVSENTSFGAPDPLNPACGDLCYNNVTKSKFWGFATALIDLDVLHNGNSSRLRSLEADGYDYALVAPTWNVSMIFASEEEADEADMTRVAGSSRAPNDPVATDVYIYDTQPDWHLYIAPREGWVPSWYAPVLAVVIVLAMIVSIMLFAVLLSRRQHQALLEALLPREMIDHLKNEADGEFGAPRIVEAATTADVLLNLLGELIEGGAPDLRDIVLIRQQILQNMDIYQPLNLSGQLRDANLDDDVTKALMHQLGGKFSFSFSSDTSCDEIRVGEDVRAGPMLNKSLTMSSQHDYATLSGALAMILSSQPGWYDSGPDMSDAASDAALPTHDTEAAVSPRPSNHSIFGRAASQIRLPEHAVSTASPRVGVAPSGGSMPTVMSSGPDSAVEGGTRLGSSTGAPAHGEQDRPPTDAISTVSASAIRVTEDGGSVVHVSAMGSAVASPGRPKQPKRNDSHTSIASWQQGRARRRSALMSVSIAADGHEGGGDKTLSNCSHMDAVTPLHGDHPPGQPKANLWATGPSRRSVTGVTAMAIGAFLSKKPPTPPPPVIEEVEKVLAQADSWHFDAFRLKEVTQGHPLSALGYFLIHRAGLITGLKLKAPVLARLLRHIEAGYNDNPYHSSTHAADVLQTTHVILHGAQMHCHYLDQLGLLAAYFAAIVHDYGHPGLTNDFLISTGDPLAVRYNDRSPLENHHAAAAFSAMRRSGLDLLSPLATEQKTAFRKQVIDMVLATDMKQHFSLLSHFNTVHRIANYTNKPQGAATPDRQSSNVGEPQSVVVAMPSMLDLGSAPKPLDETERLLSLQIVIKVADIGHLGEDLEVHKRWLSALEEEYFRQGDREKQLGLPMSPLFDRAKQGVSKSQTGFYEFVALPLVHALVSAFPGSRPLMRCFLSNYNYYRGLDGQAAVAEPRSGKLPPTASMRFPAGHTVAV